MRGVLGLKRRKPSWFDLPVMMKLTLSTPHHALKNLAKGPLTRPNNFMMIPQIQRFGYPQDVDPNKCTFITSFSSERDQWMRSKCINIHDPQSRVYELADEYDGRRAVPKNFFMLLESYQNHAEAKSLGPDGGSTPRCCKYAPVHQKRNVATLGTGPRPEFGGLFFRIIGGKFPRVEASS